MKKNLPLLKLCSASILILLLSGCLYPDSELAKNQVPNEDQAGTSSKGSGEVSERDEWVSAHPNKAKMIPPSLKNI